MPRLIVFRNMQFLLKTCIIIAVHEVFSESDEYQLVAYTLNINVDNKHMRLHVYFTCFCSLEARRAAATERLQGKLLPRIRRIREVRAQRDVVKAFGAGIANLKWVVLPCG